jgi:hypothetical protein
MSARLRCYREPIMSPIRRVGATRGGWGWNKNAGRGGEWNVLMAARQHTEVLAVFTVYTLIAVSSV